MFDGLIGISLLIFTLYITTDTRIQQIEQHLDQRTNIGEQSNVPHGHL